MHFLVRDHLIRSFDGLVEWQRKSGQLPTYSQEQAKLSDDEKKHLIAKQRCSKLTPTLVMFVYLIAFTSLAIATFFRTDTIYQDGSTKSVVKGTTYAEVVKNWNKSKCKEEEGAWDMTYSLQNACLNACGYQWFLCGLYMFSALRLPYWQKYHMMDADSYKEFAEEEQGHNTQKNWFCVGVAKLLVMGALAGPCGIPAIVLKVKAFAAFDRYAGVVIMMTNIVIPGTIVAFLYVGGPFDAIMMKILKCGKPNSDK